MTVTEAPAHTLATGLYEVELDRLTPAPDNIRQDLGNIEELTESVREQGVLEPLLVTTAGMVVCGHRRHAAARAAGKERVPCVVRDMTDTERFAAMLAENLQRTDITPVEEAKGYQALLELGMPDAEDVAAAVGVRAQRVKDRRQLLRIPLAAQVALRDGELTLGNAMALAKLADHPKEMQAIVDRIEENKGERYAYHTWNRVGMAVDSALEVIKKREAREKAIAKQPKGTKILHKDWGGSSYEFKGKGLPVHAREDYDTRGGRAVLQSIPDHRKLPCHAVAITHGGKVVECCTKPETHKGEEPPAPKGKTAAASVRRELSRADKVAEVFTATLDDRHAAERRVIEDAEEHEGLLFTAVAAIENGWEVETLGQDDREELTPLQQVLLLGLRSGAPRIGPWLRDPNPFLEDEPCHYYALLEAHGYGLSDGERELRGAADESDVEDDDQEREDGEADLDEESGDMGDDGA